MNTIHYASLEVANEANPGRLYLGRPGGRVAYDLAGDGPLVSRFRDSFAVSGEGGEDLVGGLDPDVGAGVVVPGCDPVFDVAFEFADGAVGSAFDLLGRELAEPPFDEVEPARPGRGETRRSAR